jgi:multidrug resistance efflux pump
MKMKKKLVEGSSPMKKLVTINIIVALLVVGLGIGAWYYTTNAMNFITTDDAKVQGDLSTISAPTNGKIIKWNIKEGEQVKKGDVIAEIAAANAAIPGASGQAPAPQTISVTAPADGTVIQSKGMEDQFVAAGTPLAMTVPLDRLYVVANIEEGDLKDVKEGQDVDITLDAFPNQVFRGKVQQIGLATASTFSLIPSNNSSGNYTKVTQKIPVKISLEPVEKGIVPGLNATVKIHK